ncbi:MAG: tRNA lysidine(34) synthetase TilS [Candidatus Thiodiazotropha sp. (ex. Lucinoma kazani)]
MTLTATRLLESLKQLPQASCCHLAFSGGLDSCVLLHLLAELRLQLPYELRAIHVHHGLQAEAGEWQRHCENICESYGIPLDNVQLTLTPIAGESIEAVAREARYQAFAKCMGEGDLLLTAQHQDDQAETLLLQLLRGSGPAGLAAMPLLARFEPGWLARPLLQVSRLTLEAYAQQYALTWHDDPSNQNLRFDRNFIRHQVMPLLRSRWPAASMTLSRAARFSGELLTLVKEEAEEDLVKARYGDSDTLSITALKKLHSVRLRNLLRHWIAASGATMPNSKKLARIELESVHGRIDTVPLVTWGGWEVRRYRDQLFLDRARPATNPIGVIPWSDKQLLELPHGLGRLVVESSAVGIDAARWRQGEVEVRFRHGGERCQPAGQAHHRPLKKLLQEWCVPPWERERLPLIYLDGVLAAIPGRINCQSCMAHPGEEAIQVRWERHDQRTG